MDFEAFSPLEEEEPLSLLSLHTPGALDEHTALLIETPSHDDTCHRDH